MKVMDMHCDTIYEICAARQRGEAISLRKNHLLVDLEKMKQGGYSVQNFALFIEQEQGRSSFDKVKELLSVFQSEMEQNSDFVGMVTTTEEIMENERAGKLSALLTVEGGEACEGDIDKLQYLYQQGVRMMTLTWNYPNEIGYPNFKEGFDFFTPNTEDGLTQKGFEIVDEMERMGIIIDVSHLSDAGFYDVLRYTKQPFVASHSNARAVCPWVRNLTDDMIWELANRGGVIGLNYCADFLRQQLLQDATLEDIARHAKHIANVGGVECIGLGSDFDGIPAYQGMPRTERIYELADVLEQYGFRQSEIDKIFYQNAFRVYKEVLG